jgi:SH3-like domain-containing protein
MLSKKIKFLLPFVLLTFLSTSANAYQTPKFIKIIKSSGVNVRSSIDSESEKVDSVYVDYLYDVIDANVLYYKIKTTNGVEGWVYNDSANNWISENKDKTKIKIILDSGITMRAMPYDSASRIVGLAEPGETYDILDVVFSHFKISTPRIPEGWIYVGRPGDMWIEEAK